MPQAESSTCDTLIVKVAGRCNINCTYCYMYNRGDDSYRQQPKKMSKPTVLKLLERVKEHCVKNSIAQFTFVFHGGEPLLAGEDFFRFFVQEARRILEPETRPLFAMQTNGILLTANWCKTLGALQIAIGISMDGTREAHDMYRVDFKGRGTYNAVMQGVETAKTSGFLASPPGLLCVLNVAEDPAAVYAAFKQTGLQMADIIIPDHNYDSPPPGKSGSNSEHLYGDWLIKLFDTWFAEGDARISIRLFEVLIALVLGEETEMDFLGSGKNELLVIETDGSIETVDVLKICGNGFTKAGAHVNTHSFEAAMQTPLAQLYRLANTRLPKKCTVCPVNEVCGGGYIPHRYSRTNGFNNPSVYCNDLLRLITHIQNEVFDRLPPEFIAEAGAAKITYEEALRYIESEIQLQPEPDYIHELEAFKLNV